MLIFARTPSTIVKAEAGLLSSWYFKVQTLINSGCCASVVGQRQHQGCWTQVHWGSPYPNTGPTTASLLPTQCHLKKRYMLSSGIRIWLWSFPSSWGSFTGSVWQSSSPLTEISSLLPCYFGSDCGERNSFWQIHSWNELSLAAGGSLVHFSSCSLS